MGEARRRTEKGLPPRQVKTGKDESPRIFPWLPVTQKQRADFYVTTQRGAWIGIGVLIAIWLVVRVVGPAAGWWTPADAR